MQVLRVFDFTDHGAIRCDFDLCAEPLWFPFGNANAVVKIGVLPLGQSPGGHLACHQIAAVPHEVRLGNGVLCDQPGGLRPIRTCQFFVRPAKFCDQLAERSRIFLVHSFHAWVVAIEQSAISSQFGSSGQIPLLHAQQRFTQFRKHVGDQAATASFASLSAEQAR